MKAMRHYEQITKEDLAMVLLDLECGGIAHLCASFAADDLSADPWTFMVKVIGTAGTTRYTYQDWVEAKKGISHSRVYTAYIGPEQDVGIALQDKTALLYSMTFVLINSAAAPMLCLYD
mgnify:CR=1 FL=1